MSESARTLRLVVGTPSRTAVDERVRSLTAEDPTGRFGVRPGGESLLAALVPGLLTYRAADGVERFIAVGRGILDARGDVVRIAVREAIVCESLQRVPQEVDRASRARSESEAALRIVLKNAYRDLMQSLIEEERRR